MAKGKMDSKKDDSSTGNDAPPMGRKMARKGKRGGRKGGRK